MSRPRTKEDFDAWYLSTNGDPWNYNSMGIKKRLLKSLSFIQKYVPKEYDGNIIELGSFNGDFTFLLAQYYTKSKIYANDISEIAMDKVKSKTQCFNNTEYLLQDMISLKSNQIKNQTKSIIIMLECLYYLKNNERGCIIKNISQNFPKISVFISTPIVGGDYFTEKELFELMKDNGYNMVDFKVLNLNRNYYFLNKIITFLSTINDNNIRILCSNQVIYLFSPIGVEVK